MNRNILFFILIFILSITISCKPKTADGNYEEILELLESEKYSDVIELATECIEKYPKDPRFYYERGQCYFRNKDIFGAQENFLKCIEIDPNYSIGYEGLASVYSISKKYDLAEKNYQKALELTQNNKTKSIVHGSIAFMYLYNKKDFKKAVENFEKAVEFNDKGKFFYGLGKAKYLLGEKDDAAQIWEKAINEKEFQEKKFKHKTYFELSRHLFRIEEYEKAEKFIEEAIKIAPDNNKYKWLNKRIKKALSEK